MSHAKDFFNRVVQIAINIDHIMIETLAGELADLRRRGGRLFLIGLGGSAANCSHAANDFRTLCGIEAYAPTDNAAELTAWANDVGMDSIFIGSLMSSNFNSKDAIFVLSVGGGDQDVSRCLVMAIEAAKLRMAKVLGIVGRATGWAAEHGDVVLVVPQVEPKWVTPLSESFQAVVWHCLVSHPLLQQRKTKW